MTKTLISMRKGLGKGGIGCGCSAAYLGMVVGRQRGVVNGSGIGVGGAMGRKRVNRDLNPSAFRCGLGDLALGWQILSDNYMIGNY